MGGRVAGKALLWPPMIETPLRPTIDLACGWEFRRARVGRRWLSGSGGADEVVTLPHSWNERDTFQIGRTSYSGWGAYRRRVALASCENPVPLEWQVRAGGFYGTGDVWLDGRRLAAVNGQYLGAAVRLPTAGGDVERLLAIRLDNRCRRNVLPGRWRHTMLERYRLPDHLLHGGLSGGVVLQGLPSCRFDLDRVEIVSERRSSGGERITIRWAVEGAEAARGPVAAEWSVTDPSGTTVGAATVPVAGGVGAPHAVTVEVDAPRCWRPGDPALYWAEGRLTVAGAALDVVRVRFGITRAEFRPREGFFLDGERVELRGCNRHQAIPGFGSALPDELQRRDAALLDELGCNFVRLSHYPQSPVFLDACDELGIMVYAEIAAWKSVSSATGWRRAARRQMRGMVLRDRHHPCVVLWGMGNESRSRKAYLELRSAVRELDPGRPVTYAENHFYRARRQRTLGIPDVWGINYEINAAEAGAGSCRLENVVFSEYANYSQSFKGDDLGELTQVAILEHEWEQFADLPFVAGHAVWCFADYATEYRRRFRNCNGLHDAWRRPKMAAELFRARYASRPFVSLFVTGPGPTAEPTRFRKEHRADGAGPAPFELHAFTNCETLRLARDGAMLSVLEGAIHHVLPLYGSFEEILATGSRGGVVVQGSARRPGAAERIHLKTASGSSASIVELDVEVHDAASTVVGSWNGLVRIAVGGPGRAHPYTEAGGIELARGVGRAYVTVDDEHEPVVVTVSGPGLSPGILSLHRS